MFLIPLTFELCWWIGYAAYKPVKMKVGMFWELYIRIFLCMCEGEREQTTKRTYVITSSEQGAILWLPCVASRCRTWFQMCSVIWFWLIVLCCHYCMRAVTSKAKSNRRSGTYSSYCFITRVQELNPLTTAMTKRTFSIHPTSCFIMKKRKAERAANQSFREL